MPHAASFAGLILAAGESSRMGSDKALLPWPPPQNGAPPGQDTFLSSCIRSLSLSTDFMLVVAGRNESVLAPVVYANGASLIVNPNPERGQFSSLQIGVREVLNRGRDAAVITLVDRPPASPETVETLRRAYEAASQDIWAIVPEFSGQHGHPFIAGRELIEAFLRAPASAAARDIEHQHQAHIQYVPVSDPNVVLNINTPDEYQQLSSPSR